MNGDDMVPGPPGTDRKSVISAVILFFVCLLAVVSNGFITSALCMEWLLRRTLLPCDKLLVSLGASRFCLQWVVMGKIFYILLNPMAFPYNPMHQFFAFQWDFLNSLTLWFSTWLSVFYCVKIATFTHPAFLWLKCRLSKWVPWMLLSSLGVSNLNTILFFIGNYEVYQNYLRRDLQPWNATETSVRSFYERFYFFSLKMISFTVPTVVFIICMALLTISLGKHLKKAFVTISGFRDPSAQAHIKALLALISFAILFISSFLSLVIHAAGMFPVWEFRYWTWQVVSHLCMAVHPISLIFSNPKLKAVLERGCSSR
ncbi:taste receptor type 2 member 60 [Tupaia chinensis]|uniref:Taste receptor type 2 n=1 Tax=Tupaia chinensis TaxID=246437 RepID=L9JBB5_TUPCH|nr:taste receptor type 2 member 60 [Tupaia chinensis]ELW47544.1 Taste receptor type 2 member 60 [Tupaia chinensis]